MIALIRSAVLSVWKWLVLAGAAVLSVLLLLARQSGKTRDTVAKEAAEDTLKRTKEGRDAVQDVSDATRDERIKRLRKIRRKW